LKKEKVIIEKMLLDKKENKLSAKINEFFV